MNEASSRCGANVVEEWVNVDYSLGARLAKIPGFRHVNRRLRLFDLDWDPRIFLHDLRKPFPWSDGTADSIYCSHTLEHFSRTEGETLLGECFRILRGGGVIRIVVPDLLWIVREYLDGHLPAERFVEKLGVLYGEGLSGIKRRLAPFISFPHKCMYDLKSLLSALDEAGFQAEEKAPFASRIPEIEQIEQEGRTDKAVIVEGVKP